MSTKQGPKILTKALTPTTTITAAATSEPAPARKRMQSLTERIWSLGHTPHLFVRITGPLRSEKMPQLSRNEDGTVQVIPIADLETGEAGLLLCVTVLASALERAGDYVGKSYEILSAEPREGKNYREVRVWEIE